jgi:hypothetical protein
MDMKSLANTKLDITDPEIKKAFREFYFRHREDFAGYDFEFYKERAGYLYFTLFKDIINISFGWGINSSTKFFKSDSRIEISINDIKNLERVGWKIFELKKSRTNLPTAFSLKGHEQYHRKEIKGYYRGELLVKKGIILIGTNKDRMGVSKIISI